MSDFWNTVLPGWLSSVGTVGAFATGGILLGREVHRDREREFEDKKSHARTFAVWIVRDPVQSAGPRSVVSRLQLSNTSSEPIYHVVVYFYPHDSQRLEERIGMVPPGTHQRSLPPSLNETLVWSQTGWKLDSRPNDPPIADLDARERNFTIAVEFTDSAGNRWRRSAEGILTLGS